MISTWNEYYILLLRFIASVLRGLRLYGCDVVTPSVDRNMNHRHCPQILSPWFASTASLFTIMGSLCCAPEMVHLQTQASKIPAINLKTPFSTTAIIIRDTSNKFDEYTDRNRSYLGGALYYTINVGETVANNLAATLKQSFDKVLIKSRKYDDMEDAFVFTPLIKSVKWWVPCAWSEAFEIDLQLQVNHGPTDLNLAVESKRTVTADMPGGSYLSNAVLNVNLTQAGGRAITQAIDDCLIDMFSSDLLVTALSQYESQILSANTNVTQSTRGLHKRQPQCNLNEFSRRLEHEHSSIAVIDIDVGMETLPGVGRALGDLCRDIVQRSQVYILIDRENMKNVLGEQDLALVLKCDNTKCLVRYGRILSAQKMLHGRVSKLESTHVVYLGLTDVETAQIEATATTRIEGGIDEVGNVLPELACTLLREALRKKMP